MAFRVDMAAMFFSMVVFCFACDVSDVAVYKVTLQTFWSEEMFPKDYPIYRPKAQWSRVFGQSHNSSYHLFKLGDVASEAVRKFSQFGTIDDISEEEDPRVYDQFIASPIGHGVGKTQNVVFVDKNHHLISLMTKIIPSPDWFVGVDSLGMCVDSTWIEEITLDLEPLDAGAASGLTFTAPRWESTPPEKVIRHGPKSPNHPAAGFYYPGLKVLPTIAKVTFLKVKEYSTKDLNDLARKDLITKFKLKDEHKNSLKRDKMIEEEEATVALEEITTKNYMDRLKDVEEEPLGTAKPNLPDNYVEVVTAAAKITSTEAEFDENLRNMDDVMLAVARGHKLGLGKHLPRHFRSRLHHAINKLTPNDCLVSAWGEWTSCSVTCGFGEKFRTREVLRQPTLDGRECPKLTERAHCGNANSCYEMEYFDW